MMLGEFMNFEFSVGPPIDLGQRRCVPIAGGTVSGTYTGTIIPGGADWQVVANDGTIDIDARYVLDLTEGRVEVWSRGLRSGSAEVLARLANGEIVDPSDYYFRTALRFTTVASSLERLNRIIAIGRGERLPGKVRLSVYEVI